MDKGVFSNAIETSDILMINKRRRSQAQISHNMSMIKSKGSEIEKVFASALRRNKVKYKKHPSSIEGKPDFIIPHKMIAIFCDGSFWHGYKKMKTKRHNFKSNIKFWQQKILRNIARDKEVNKLLKKRGWKVLRFWDFQIINNVDKCLKKIYSML